MGLIRVGRGLQVRIRIGCKYCICIRHRVRNLMFITVARSVGSRRAGACAWDLVSQGERISLDTEDALPKCCT